METDCASDTVDAGDCIQEAPVWYARWSRGPPRHLRCLPSFVIAGAQKAATGFLRQRLARHPQLAQGGGKEVHYFDRLDGAVDKTWATTYLDEFAATTATVTSTTMLGPGSGSRAHKCNKNTKQYEQM